VRRDAILLLSANALRNLGYGMLDVLLVLYLAEIGVKPVSIAALITATLFGSAILNLLVGMFADRVGRRRMLAMATAIMILAGLVLTLSTNLFVLLVAALTGTLNFASVSTGPFVALDQATLPQLVSPENRNRAYGVYNAAALLARMLGALVSAAPNVLHAAAGVPMMDGYRLTLASFVVLGMISLVCLAALSPAMEAKDAAVAGRRVFRLERSRSRVFRMSALFSVDGFTSGLAANSLIVLLFHQRFGVGAEVLGPAYSVARLLQALSYQVAVRFANRFGLLNTMVFTHLPSQFLLMALPFAATLPVGIALLLLRQSLAHMDLPTRQAYLATIVEPEERTPAAGFTNLTRNIAQGISPTLTGYAYQAMAFAVPFVAAGSLGVLYDLGMYVSFRKVRPGDEAVLLAGRRSRAY
jgi:MFS family permease